ncbi:MAG: ParB N-terminal domain-containing protein [Candidatus Poseidoniaceae archaeon]|jgi:hypothetical protein|tara:strand:+ start:2097 stop:2531 length:435 start_codon:yes stop_codon:yes gene_type:complete
MWEEADVQLVPVEWLKPHEEIKPRNRDKLLEMTKRWGGYTKPLIVDKVTGAILDGHHRFSIASKLGLAQIPVIAVDYLNDETIEVDVWPSATIESLTKQEVIEMSLSGEVFPPKTSRHRIADHLPPIHFPLEVLAQPAPIQPQD